nr:MAG TPA: hypothetical protein [Caudoviricetes sp.]
MPLLNKIPYKKIHFRICYNKTYYQYLKIHNSKLYSKNKFIRT